MTLQGVDRITGARCSWVVVPLELVDWMALRFDLAFPKYLAGIDPYSDVKISDDRLPTSVNELTEILEALRRQKGLDVPIRVELFGTYGLKNAKRTVEAMVNFFREAIEKDWKVISIGD